MWFDRARERAFDGSLGEHAQRLARSALGVLDGHEVVVPHDAIGCEECEVAIATLVYLLGDARGRSAGIPRS